MIVKESFNVAGLPTTWGIPGAERIPVLEDAVAVARLKTAGAIVFGKTNVPLMLAEKQSYHSVYGTTNNAWDPGRTPGGSSGGSAAALAAGYISVELGTDLDGTLRVPASFCGVVAHKPTHGIVPLRDILTEHPLLPTAGSVRAALDEIANRLARRGVKVARTSPLLPDLARIGRVFTEQLLAIVGADFPGRRVCPAGSPPPRRCSRRCQPAAVRLRGSVMSYRKWTRTDRIRTGIADGWHRLFRECDVVLCPARPRQPSRTTIAIGTGGPYRSTTPRSPIWIRTCGMASRCSRDRRRPRC